MKDTVDTSPYKAIKYVAKGHNLSHLKYDKELEALFTLEEYKITN